MAGGEARIQLFDAGKSCVPYPTLLPFLSSFLGSEPTAPGAARPLRRAARRPTPAVPRRRSISPICGVEEVFGDGKRIRLFPRLPVGLRRGRRILQCRRRLRRRGNAFHISRARTGLSTPTRYRFKSPRVDRSHLLTIASKLWSAADCGPNSGALKLDDFCSQWFVQCVITWSKNLRNVMDSSCS